ncbi:hypothetical protein J0S82_002862 [Galemys pyrenaicus]|uniref:Uncharacterized protein n=1 Tax=Galemys pyrenaicus TaxID=202257 RepID=A0A8J6AV04_GALPY|nr:hypothetical protein J0S82_002862 [Galemys pyrenaicus]
METSASVPATEKKDAKSGILEGTAFPDPGRKASALAVATAAAAAAVAAQGDRWVCTLLLCPAVLVTKTATFASDRGKRGFTARYELGNPYLCRGADAYLALPDVGPRPDLITARTQHCMSTAVPQEGPCLPWPLAALELSFLSPALCLPLGLALSQRPWWMGGQPDLLLSQEGHCRCEDTGSWLDVGLEGQAFSSGN